MYGRQRHQPRAWGGPSGEVHQLPRNGAKVRRQPAARKPPDHLPGLSLRGALGSGRALLWPPMAPRGRTRAIALRELPRGRATGLSGYAHECASDCHQSDYDLSPEPGHDAFPTTCEGCHSSEQWVPALSTLDHPWPFEGAHAQASCLSCHVGDPPVYQGTPTECVGCHQDDYDGNAFEGHDAFPTTCQDCHTNDAWVPAQFDHSWPLEGAHAQATCSSCHTGNPPTYEGTPTVCIDCHQSDYDGSPYLGHSDFPTTCADCHSTGAWSPATGGNHPENAFPIESGPHSKYRNDCTSCHDTALGSSIGGENADCVGCHEGDHTRAKMDSKHTRRTRLSERRRTSELLPRLPRGRSKLTTKPYHTRGTGFERKPWCLERRGLVTLLE